MNVEVILLFFAKAREITGKSKTTVTIPSTVRCVDLMNAIADEFSLQDIRNTIVLALNQEFRDSTDILILHEGDEIAVIPPLSGG